MVADARFSTNQLRVKNLGDLTQILDHLFATKSAAHWIELLGKIEIPVGAINNIKEAIELATTLGLDPVVDIAGSKSIANPITFSKTPVTYSKAPPKLS